MNDRTFGQGTRPVLSTLDLVLGPSLVRGLWSVSLVPSALIRSRLPAWTEDVGLERTKDQERTKHQVLSTKDYFA